MQSLNFYVDQSILFMVCNKLGYREKVFAIIGVKVYAAGLYLNDSIFSKFNAWKGRSAAEIQEDSSLFDLIFQSNFVVYLDFFHLPARGRMLTLIF